MSGKLGTLTLDSGASSAATLTTVVCCARGVSHYVAFCSTPGQEPLVRAGVAVEETFVPETDSLARS